MIKHYRDAIKAPFKIYLVYFILGIIIFIITATLQIYRLDIAKLLTMNANLIYDTQPKILKTIFEILGLLPFFVIFLFLIIGIKKKNIAKCLAVSGGITVSFCMFFTYILFGDSIKDYINKKDFDSIVWKKSIIHNLKNPVRIYMVDDLLKKYKLVGMNKNEIDSLLGVAPETEYFKEYDYVYWLGPERSWIRIDSEWLCLKFKNNKVIEAKILRD